MYALSVAAPALKLMFERVGRPQVHNLPELLLPGGGGAVIVCNHVGWADSLWVAYAIYPRQLRYMSKLELFGSPITRWVMEQGGSIPLDRNDPQPSSIKAAVDLLKVGELILIFPSGTRSSEHTAFKRGAATIALHAQVPIVPAFYQGPKQMHLAHLLGRPIATTGLAIDRTGSSELTQRLQAAVEQLRPVAGQEFAAA
jgi:1-acyl-sn-glycerol-3-phosphate acyltransferase